MPVARGTHQPRLTRLELDSHAATLRRAPGRHVRDVTGRKRARTRPLSSVERDCDFLDCAPARRLYGRNGFTVCEPFADYVPDPNSVFMSLELKADE